jgi:hypothetical protein
MLMEKPKGNLIPFACMHYDSFRCSGNDLLLSSQEKKKISAESNAHQEKETIFDLHC